MGISKVQDIGTNAGSSFATSTTVAFSGATKPAVGDLIVVHCARDNVDTDPLDDTLTDTDGNTYSKVIVQAGDTSAQLGIVAVRFHCVVTSAWSAGTNTVTWTHPDNRRRVFTVEHYTKDSGESFAIGSSWTDTDTASTCSVATGSVASGSLVSGTFAAEYGTARSPSFDSDTTNGSWVGNTSTTVGSGGSAGANVYVARQRKITTGAGAQTWDISETADPAVDCAAIVVEYTVSAGSGVTGTASASWPAWSSTASGTVGVEGDASTASWPAWSATAAGDVAHDGQATATWPSWAATAQGEVEVTGQATAPWPSWSGTAAGDVAHDGQAAASWPGWSSTADGTVGVEGDASTAWPSWSATAQGEVDVIGQATASWPSWVGTATGSGQGAGEGTATASWPGWSATAAGEVAHDGTASASWPAWSSTASGVTGKAGTATAAWPSWTAASTGVRGVEGTASAAWPTWDGSIVITPPAAISRPYRVALDTSGHVQVAHDRRSRVSAAIDTSLRPSLELNP